MMTQQIDGINVVWKSDKPLLEGESLYAYVDRGIEKYGDHLTEMILSPAEDDPEQIDIEYITDASPFHRLRRITGYLVGSLNRWNNGKRAEERDRVKHIWTDKK